MKVLVKRVGYAEDPAYKFYGVVAEIEIDGRTAYLKRLQAPHPHAHDFIEIDDERVVIESFCTDAKLIKCILMGL